MNDTEDVVITDADYALTARYDDAVCRLKALEYQASCIMLEARRKVERLRTATDQAKARVKRLTPSYQAMCARIRVDPVTGEDIEDEDEEQAGGYH